MIIELTMYGCKCDSCGNQWADEHNGFVAFTDKASIKNMISDDDTWYVHHESLDVKHYCPKCWSFDNEDNLVLREIIKK